MVSELTKLLGETTWFKKSGHDRITSMDNKGRIGQLKRKPDTNSTTTPKSVHFVDQTPEMEMAAGLRELFPRLEPTVGFFVICDPPRSIPSHHPMEWRSFWEARGLYNMLLGRRTAP